MIPANITFVDMAWLTIFTLSILVPTVLFSLYTVTMILGGIISLFRR